MVKGITLQELDTSVSSRLVIKDSAGRAKVTAPSASEDIALKSTVDNAVGTLSSLLTTDKTNIVKAINELFTNVSDGKNVLASAITGKGVPTSGSDTFAQLAAKIGLIITGKRVAEGTGVTSTVSGGNNYGYLTVSGLSFTPMFVMAYMPNYIQEYKHLIMCFNYDNWTFTVRKNDNNVGFESFVVADRNGFQLQSNGFYVPLNVGGYNVKWYASE